MTDNWDKTYYKTLHAVWKDLWVNIHFKSSSYPLGQCWTQTGNYKSGYQDARKNRWMGHIPEIQVLLQLKSKFLEIRENWRVSEEFLFLPLSATIISEEIFIFLYILLKGSWKLKSRALLAYILLRRKIKPQNRYQINTIISWYFRSKPHFCLQLKLMKVSVLELSGCKSISIKLLVPWI